LCGCSFKAELTNWVEEPLSVTEGIKELPKTFFPCIQARSNKFSQNILRQFLSPEKNKERFYNAAHL
jgi:hypothetical protein